MKKGERICVFMSKYKIKKCMLSLITIFLLIFTSCAVCADQETVSYSKYENIEYPIFYGIANEDTINQFVLENVKQISPDIEIYPVKESNTIVSQIMEQNAEVISIVYSGVLTSDSCSIIMLTEVYSCLSINVITCEQIKLGDVVEIDDSFVDTYIDKLNEEWERLYPNEDNAPFGKSPYDFEYVKSKLLSADEFQSISCDGESALPDITSCLLENDQILISFALPQALGFHIEVKMKI